MNSSGYNSTTKIWSGSAKPPIFNSDAGIGYLVLNCLKITPDRVIEICADDDTEITCGETFEKSVKLCRFLLSIGLKQHDVVGIIGRNSKNLTPLVFACLTLGLPINALSPIFDDRKMLSMYSDTKPKLVFCDSDLIHQAERIIDKIGLEDCKIITLMAPIEGFQFVDVIIENSDKKVDDFEIPFFEDISTTLAFIFNSSGTTGEVKGICRNHKDYMLNIPSFNMTNECIFVPTTLNWVNTAANQIACAIYGIKRIISVKDITSELYVEIINKYKVTRTFFFKLLLNLIDKSKSISPMYRVQRVTIGAVVLTEELIQKVQKLFPNAKMLTAYGSTEVGMVSIGIKSVQSWSSGKLVNGYQAKIIDDYGNNLGPNEIGEIYIKPSVLFGGYFNQPEKTANVIREGWFKSGDAGYFDNEGFLFVLDRLEDLLTTNVKFSSTELENVINEIEEVEECAVVGVKNGSVDIIYAFVIKNPESSLTSDFIEKFVADRVDDCKKLTGGVHFINEIKKTPSSGKVMKFVLKELAQKIHSNKI